MNRLLLSLFLTCATLCSYYSYGQSLSKSRASSYFTYIYKLTDEEVYAAAANRVNDSFMHNLVDSFYTESDYKKELPYGNYLYVNAVNGELSYSYKPVYNVMVTSLNNTEDMQLSIVDQSGKIVKNATVLLGKKKVQFDMRAQLYTTSANPIGAVVTVKYQNISNFFYYEGVEEFKENNRRKSKTYKANRSFFIFNKPIYRPLDTVRFKAFILDYRGKVKHTKPLRVEVGDKQVVVIPQLTPYRPGGYEGHFVLTEDLKLELDKKHSVELKENVKGDWRVVTRDNIEYSDYELKSMQLLVRTDRKQHKPAKPITVYMKAVDENQLTIPDARVEIVITVGEQKFHKVNTFIKDTLWKKTVMLDPVGDTKLVLPDSIFAEADMGFIAQFRLLNSSNESSVVREYLSYRNAKEEVSANLMNGKLKLEYLLEGKSHSAKATIFSHSEEFGPIDTMLLDLPASLVSNPYVSDYKVVLSNGFTAEIDATMLDTPAPIINAELVRDSLKYSISNSNTFPFWYTVYEDDKTLFTSYALSVDTAIRFNYKKPVRILVTYLAGGRLRYTRAYTYYDADRLKLSLKAPDLVYPGQEVDMEVRVTDPSSNAVADADVSAYAYTAKFPKSPSVNTPLFKVPKLKEVKTRQSSYVGTAEYSGKLKLDWDKWRRQLGLDTMAYYQFVQTKDMFTAIEDVNDTMAIVAPFVIKEGKIAPAFTVYIDGIPVYYDQAQQLKRYAFRVNPGSHTVKIRTAGNEVLYIGNFEAGKKVILGIAADPANTKAGVSTADLSLTNNELDEINKYLVHINNNFSDIKTVLSTDNGQHLLLNPLPIQNSNTRLQIGPLSDQYLTFKSGSINRPFMREPGFSYTFYSDMIHQRSLAVNPLLGRRAVVETSVGTELDHSPITEAEIDSIWNEFLDLRSRTQGLFDIDFSYKKGTGKLKFDLDTAIVNRLPYLKNLVIYNNSDPEFLQIYPGKFNHIAPLMPGSYKLLFLFKDNRYFIKDEVEVLAHGTNYYYIDDILLKSADSLSMGLDSKIKALGGKNIKGFANQFAPEIHRVFTPGKFDQKLLVTRIKGQVLDAATKEYIPGAGIYYKDGKKMVNIGRGDADGSFDLMVPAKGKLIFSFISYRSKEVNISETSSLIVLLTEEQNVMNEVVIRGYAQNTRQMQKGPDKQGIVYGYNIQTTGSSIVRGDEKVNAANKLSGIGAGKPLIIVDNLPFKGELASIDPNTIISVGTLTAQEAVGLYGEAAKYGVIIVKTTAMMERSAADKDTTITQLNIRSRFSDYAIWQPKLNTNENGVTRFKVRFPDDVTSWTTGVVAINGKQQSGSMQKQIKSFKTLSANLLSPQFALAGDSIRIIGKLMNYTAASETAQRKFSYNGHEILNSKVSFENAHIDSTFIVASKAGAVDSLTFLYTMQQDNGYSDGESRKIPMLPVGVLETKGYFSAMIADTTVNYVFDPELGKVTLKAEASVFPVLLDEVDKIRRYEYFCNEQIASKLKALLAEKQVRELLGDDFKEEKNIRTLVKNLLDNRRPEGAWGWWKDSETEDWISLHVAEALMEARKQGYNVPDKEGTIAGLKAAIETVHRGRLTMQQKTNPAAMSLYSKLQLMWYNQGLGIDADIKWLLGIKKKTLMGNSFWGEPSIDFWDNSIQNTLLAYKILKAQGGHAQELDQITRYFLEQRRDGQWRNTYESSLILETILPELLKTKSAEKPVLTLNKSEVIKGFPFSRQIDAAALSVTKTGMGLVYFSAYQQYHNTWPDRIAKDFIVSSNFIQVDMPVSSLTAGKVVTLKVEVEVTEEANYVMIDVPIPAGCSYENKMQSNWGAETHREYFKHKASIFCSKLKKGKHVFNIDLMPRYSGSYTLNPARAELMYFPVFYGREGMKKVSVK